MHRVEKKLIKNSKSTFFLTEETMLRKYGRVDEVPQECDFIICMAKFQI